MDVLDDPLDPPQDWAREHVERYVATDGADPTLGHIWRNGAPVLLLTTLGRHTARARRTPLIYGRDGDRYLVVASKGGSDTAPMWYHNLVAHPGVRIQVGGSIVDARARTADPDEKARLWPIMTAVWPDYDTYQNRTTRQIPVVIIEPEHTEGG